MLGSVLSGHEQPDAPAKLEPVKSPRAFRDLLVARFREDQKILPAVPAIRGAPQTYFRASALGKFCGRAVALQIAHKKRIQSDLDPQTLHMFAKGHAYHYMHQEKVLPLIAKNGLLGWWASPTDIMRANHDDGRPKLWSMAQAEKHLKCKSYELRYVEPASFDHFHMLRGHTDAIVDWSALDFSHPDHPNEPEVFEFKTRHDSDWMWSAVDPEMGGKPLDEHVLQLQAYLMLTGIGWGRIIYMKKGDDELQDGLHGSYAEWRVKSDPDYHTKIRKYLLSWHELVLRAHLEKVVPPNTRCQEFSKGKAVKCAMRHFCFDKVPKKPSDTLVDMSLSDHELVNAHLQSFLDTLEST